MCDRCRCALGCSCLSRESSHHHHHTMMSVLGGPHLPYPDPMRSGLLGGGPVPSSALGLGLTHSSLLSVPLWRPTATHAPAAWCTVAGCPCNISRASYAELLELYTSVPSSQNVWRPWHSKHSGNCSVENFSLFAWSVNISRLGYDVVKVTHKISTTFRTYSLCLYRAGTNLFNVGSFMSTGDHPN